MSSTQISKPAGNGYELAVSWLNASDGRDIYPSSLFIVIQGKTTLQTERLEDDYVKTGNRNSTLYAGTVNTQTAFIKCSFHCLRGSLSPIVSSLHFNAFFSSADYASTRVAAAFNTEAGGVLEAVRRCLKEHKRLCLGLKEYKPGSLADT